MRYLSAIMYLLFSVYSCRSVATQFIIFRYAYNILTKVLKRGEGKLLGQTLLNVWSPLNQSCESMTDSLIVQCVPILCLALQNTQFCTKQFMLDHNEIN